VAFLGHLGLNNVQKSKGKAKNPLNGHMQEQQRLALLDAQTHTQSQSYAPQPAPSTRQQGGFGVKRKAHGAWGG
jgi:hypothetical protein